jgi:hypothetical protein
MPTSDRQGKFVAKALINQANPTNIWDIGPGEGTYYHLIEDDGPNNEWYSGNFHHWTAVEIWQPYVDKYDLRSMYDNLVVADVRDVDFSEVGTFLKEDLIIFGDVLEHMPEDDARRVILRAKKSFRWILVSLPIVHAPQGEVNGNPYEAHLKHWTFDEMHEVMGKCMAFKGSTLGVFWWDSEEDV